MLSKAKKDGSGKIKDGVRKDMILRYVSACKDDELKYFLELLFSPVLCFTGGILFSFLLNSHLYM